MVVEYYEQKGMIEEARREFEEEIEADGSLDSARKGFERLGASKVGS